MIHNSKFKIVTIGGGTGSFTFLTELKELPNVEITAVVAMSDSGGSTGKLRVDMGVLPAGDVRQALVALSRSPKKLRELFTYRYDVGTMMGHTFGNLFLSTLEKITGSMEEAITQAGKILNVKGRIYPVTLTNHQLIVEMPNGEIIHGEGSIDTRYIAGYSSISLTDSPILNPNVARAIKEADMVIIAPGNFYCSIIPNILVPGLKEVLQTSKAKKVLIANLLVKKGHTNGFTVAKFLTELQSISDGFVPDTVVYNTRMKVTHELVELHKREIVQLGDVSELEKEYGIEFIGADIVSDTIVIKNKVDTIKRSLLRHDAKKVLKLLGLEK